MTFHSRPIAELGQVLNRLAKCVTDGAPIASALDIVRTHLAACAVVLAVDHREHPPVFFTSGRENPEGEATVDGSKLAAMTESWLSLCVAETAADDAATYTLWAFRERHLEKFDADETATAGILAAQISRNLEMAKRMDNSEVERALYSDVLHKLNVGVVIVDASGKVTNASAVAHKFFSNRDGLQLQGGKLRAVNNAEDRELRAAIKAASQRTPGGEAGPSRGLSLTKHSGARTLGVMIRPLTSGSQSASAVAIYIRDCDLAPEVESEFVRQIFDLTPAEAAVTRRLTAGLSLEDAATSLDISRNTARAHLRSIFSKSGITRQTELVRLVLNSAVILGEGSPQTA
ncbi:MAG: helix-turn-helix transcriptional regulator [Pseudomonadota bacterium]|jgi:DNA-binding CsgD family transcriptional regulator